MCELSVLTTMTDGPATANGAIERASQIGDALDGLAMRAETARDGGDVRAAQVAGRKGLAAGAFTVTFHGRAHRCIRRVVDHDVRDRQLHLLRREQRLNAELERTVADDVDDARFRPRELHADRAAHAPAERAAGGGEMFARRIGNDRLGQIAAARHRVVDHEAVARQHFVERFA